MITVVCAIRDSAAGAFMAPMALPSCGVAIRSFRSQCNRAEESNLLFHSPDDFELWHLSDFDDEGGLFVACERRCIARGKDMKEA